MFENEYTLNKEYIKEYVYKILCKKIIIVGAIITILGIIMYLLIDNEYAYTMLIASFTAIFCAIIGPIMMTKQFEDAAKRLNNGKIEKTHIMFSDNIVMDEGKVHLEFEYSQIKEIKETKNFIVLMLSSQSSILVLKTGFIDKNKDEFMSFIKEKTNKF